MKWFKHFTNMRSDEKITKLFHLHGHRGVLLYIWILEIIAEQMNESDKCGVTHSLQMWAKMLSSRPDHALIYVSSMHHLGLIIASSSGDDHTISCPKLLKIRARQNLIGYKTRHTEVEVDTEVDKELLRRQKPVTAKAVPTAPRSGTFVSRIQKYFLKKWEEKYQTSYIGFSYGQSGALLKNLPTDIAAAPQKVEEAIDMFLLSEDDFVLKSRHSFSVFYKAMNQWLVKITREDPMEKAYRKLKEEQERKKQNDVR